MKSWWHSAIYSRLRNSQLFYLTVSDVWNFQLLGDMVEELYSLMRRDKCVLSRVIWIFLRETINCFFFSYLPPSLIFSLSIPSRVILHQHHHHLLPLLACLPELPHTTSLKFSLHVPPPYCPATPSSSFPGPSSRCGLASSSACANSTSPCRWSANVIISDPSRFGKGGRGGGGEDVCHNCSSTLVDHHLLGRGAGHHAALHSQLLLNSDLLYQELPSPP